MQPVCARAGGGGPFGWSMPCTCLVSVTSVDLRQEASTHRHPSLQNQAEIRSATANKAHTHTHAPTSAGKVGQQGVNGSAGEASSHRRLTAKDHPIPSRPSPSDPRIVQANRRQPEASSFTALLGPRDDAAPASRRIAFGSIATRKVQRWTPSLGRSLSLSLCPSLALSACLSVCLPACLPGWLAGWLAVCLSVCLTLTHSLARPLTHSLTH